MDCQRDVADFIEKENAAVSFFEESLVIAVRSGECAFTITEEFSFD